MARRPDNRQQSLLPAWSQYETERRAAVRGALHRLGVRSQIAFELECLILYLDRYSDESGCGAFASTLARAPRGGDKPPLPTRTLERRLAVARLHGLVSSSWSRGRRRHTVDWARIRALASSPTPSLTTNRQPPIPAQKVAEGSAKVAEGSAKVAEGSAKVAEGHIKELKSSSREQLQPPPFAPQSPSERMAPAMMADVGGEEGEGFAVVSSSPVATCPSPLAAGDYRQLETALRRCGVAAVDLAIATAKARGLAASFVRAAIAHWESRAPAWQPGAILICLRRACPGDTASDARLWPPPSAEHVRQARLASVSARNRDAISTQAQTREQAQCEARASAQREQRLEAAHGVELDELSAPRVAALVERVLPTPAERRFYLRDLTVRPIPAGTLRKLLLRELASNPAHPANPVLNQTE